MNRALPNLHGWSLEITHTVPLRLEIGIEPVAEFKEFERGLTLSRGLNMVGST